MTDTELSLEAEYLEILARFETLRANLELAISLDDAPLAAQTAPELEAVRLRLEELHAKIIALTEERIARISAFLNPTN